jgi:flagellar biosynthesis component FlhA
MEVYADSDGCEARVWSELGMRVRESVDHHKVDLLDDGATRRALDYVEKSVPDLVSGVVPAVITLTQLTAVLRALLREDITTRHMDVILQTVAESGGKCTDRGLVAEVRAALAPAISSSVAVDRQIQGVAVEPLLDLVLAKAEESGSLISGELIDAICSRVSEIVRPGAVLIASKRSRAYLRDIVHVRSDEVRVLAHEEISPRYAVVPVGALELVGEVERAALAQAVM